MEKLSFFSLCDVEKRKGNSKGKGFPCVPSIPTHTCSHAHTHARTHTYTHPELSTNIRYFTSTLLSRLKIKYAWRASPSIAIPIRMNRIFWPIPEHLAFFPVGAETQLACLSTTNTCGNGPTLQSDISPDPGMFGVDSSCGLARRTTKGRQGGC